MIVLHYNKHVSDLKQSLSLPHTQQGFNWSWIAGSLRGLKVAGSLMINEVRLCECVSKCVRMFALRRGVKWLRKTTGSSGTAKSLPVTNHRLSNMFKCHRAITRNEVSAVSSVFTCLQTLSFQLIAVVFLVLFFLFHVSDVVSCIFLIKCCSWKSLHRHDFSIHCSVSFTKLTLLQNVHSPSAICT